MIGAGIWIDVETMAAVEADCALVVPKDVEPHQPVAAQPVDAGPHQCIRDAAPVEAGIDHQPVELTALRRMDGRNHVTRELAINEGGREKLVLVFNRSQRSLQADSHHPSVRLDFVGLEIVPVEGRLSGPLRQGSDVSGNDMVQDLRVVQKLGQDILR